MIKRIVDEFVLEKFAFKKTISVNEFLDFLYIPKNLRKKLFNEKRILIEKENVSELCEVSELKERDVVVFDLNGFEENDIVEYKEKKGIDIFYEDEEIILVNKPRGILVHPDGNSNQTIANFLSYYLKGKVRSCHRIDYDTTGLVLFCKNIIAYHYINHQMENGEIKKQYIAIVNGYLKDDEGEITYNIGSDRHHNNRYVVCKNGKSAYTKYKVLIRKNNMTKVLVDIKTGRTHQIRVHFAHINHALVGDKIYGEKSQKPLLLHSYLLGFRHPKTYKYNEYILKEGKEFKI